MSYFASFSEFAEKILTLSYWEIMSDIHGGLSMFSLILFGGVITLYFSLGKFAKAFNWFKTIVVLLFTSIFLLDFMGLFIYRPYRAKTDFSPRTILKASEETSWLHTIVFEHKEHLAFAPLIIMLVVAIIVVSQGKSLSSKSLLKRVVLFGIVTSLVYVLVVAAEAVLVTKTAPLR